MATIQLRARSHGGPIDFARRARISSHRTIRIAFPTRSSCYLGLSITTDISHHCRLGYLAAAINKASRHANTNRREESPQRKISALNTLEIDG